MGHLPEEDRAPLPADRQPQDGHRSLHPPAQPGALGVSRLQSLVPPVADGATLAATHPARRGASGDHAPR